MKKLLAAILCLLPGTVWAACPAATVTIKDGNGTSQTLCYNGSAGQLAPQVTIMDTAGTNIAGVTSGNALKVDATATTQPGNITQLGGNTIKTNSGNGSTGSLNVYIATDQPTLTNAQPGQFVSLGAIGAATAVDQNTGNASAGTQRTAIATNNPAIANWGQGATASAVPTGAVFIGGSGSGNLTGLVTCDNYVFKHGINSATDTLAIQGVTSKTIKICGWMAHFTGSAAQAVALENTASTNANCSSANTIITASRTGNATTPDRVGDKTAFWAGLANTNGNGLCINSTGTGVVDVEIWFTQGS